MQLSEHFDSSEFDCHGGSYCNCGGQGARMNQEFIKRLEKLRYNIGGLPLSINSGYRCYSWNNSPYVGGAGDSQHCHWCAADIAVPVGLTIGEFLWYVRNCQLFDGIGYYPREYDGSYGYEDSRYGRIHVDLRSDGNEINTYYWEG